MKPIHFRGQNYDPAMLARLNGQGHRQTVPTADIIDLIAVSSFEARIAVQVDGKYHLLLGRIDKNAPSNELYILSRPVLKKALVEPKGYAERRQDQLSHNDQMRGFGSGHFPPPKAQGYRAR